MVEKLRINNDRKEKTSFCIIDSQSVKNTDTDGASAITMIKNAKENLSEVKNILVDGGYTGEKFANEIKEINVNTKVEVVKRNELHSFVVLPKRWVVERALGWLEKCRWLWKNCERKINSCLQMVVLHFISLLLRRF